MPSKQLYGFQLSVAACALITPSVALATYSIAAVDMSTQEVGGAITSCVGSLDVGIVYGALPGVGVIHAQAQLDQRGRAKTRALELMMQGTAPKDIIAEITDASFDPQYASRQYGLVDIMGRTAGFTGAQAQAYKRDQQGTMGSFAFSVQGNILTSQAVLDQATTAFEAPACDLAERLMRALEAGAERGEGDSRCTSGGIPSDSAFIQVDRPGQSEPYLRLSVADTGPESPLPMLRKQFDAWRKQHPCAMPSSTQAGAAAMSGSGGAGTSPAAGSGGIASSSTAGSAGMSIGGAGASAGAPGSAIPATAGASASATNPTSAGASASNASAQPTGGRAAAPTATGGASAAANSGNGATPSSGSAAPAPAANSVSQTSDAQTQEPARASSGCSLTPSKKGMPTHWLLTAAALWLARRKPRSAKAPNLK